MSTAPFLKDMCLTTQSERRGKMNIFYIIGVVVVVVAVLGYLGLR